MTSAEPLGEPLQRDSSSSGSGRSRQVTTRPRLRRSTRPASTSTPTCLGTQERGSALVELTWLGVLLLIPMLWIVLSVFDVQRGAFGVSGAARAAGRAYVLAPTDAVGQVRAEAAARQALADQGLAGAPVAVTVSCTPYPHDCHQGTSVVTVRVSTRVQLPLLPAVLGGGAPSFALDARHTVPVGQYQEVDRADP